MLLSPSAKPQITTLRSCTRLPSTEKHQKSKVERGDGVHCRIPCRRANGSNTKYVPFVWNVQSISGLANNACRTRNAVSPPLSLTVGVIGNLSSGQAQNFVAPGTTVNGPIKHLCILIAARPPSPFQPTSDCSSMINYISSCQELLNHDDELCNT